jgi:hypothetical protein
MKKEEKGEDEDDDDDDDDDEEGEGAWDNGDIGECVVCLSLFLSVCLSVCTAQYAQR